MNAETSCDQRMNKAAILTQTVEQLESMNAALAALRLEYLLGQPRTFAILAEGPLEEIRRLQTEIEQLTTSWRPRLPKQHERARTRSGTTFTSWPNDCISIRR